MVKRIRTAPQRVIDVAKGEDTTIVFPVPPNTLPGTPAYAVSLGSSGELAVKVMDRRGVPVRVVFEYYGEEDTARLAIVVEQWDPVKERWEGKDTIIEFDADHKVERIVADDPVPYVKAGEDDGSWLKARDGQ